MNFIIKDFSVGFVKYDLMISTHGLVPYGKLADR